MPVPPAPTTVATHDRTITARHGDLRVRDYVPAVSDTGAAALVWVHGGGFGAGGLDMPESHAVATALAAAGHPVTTVDYHLVPAFPLVGRFRLKPSPNRYPVPVDDVADAFLDTTARHPGRAVVLGGASAGACLAASAAIGLRDGATRAPAGLALAYGLFHARLPTVSAALRARLRGIARLGIGPEMIRRMTLNYVGDEALAADPAVFPGTADVHGLPRTLLVDADRDALRASGEAFAEHLRAAGVPLEVSVVHDARHGFLDKPAAPGFSQAITLLAGWLARPAAGRPTDAGTTRSPDPVTAES